MKFEQFPTEQTPAQEVYEAQGLKGPALDFERIFNSADRSAALAQNPEANAFYREVVEVIDTDHFPIEGANVEKIIQAIRFAVKDGGSERSSYDAINSDSVRAELEKEGIPMRERFKLAA